MPTSTEDEFALGDAETIANGIPGLGGLGGLGTVKVPLPFGLAAAALVDVVPLSQISEATLAERKRSKRLDDSESVGSSLWATMSSSQANSFSRVSVDSLGELHEPFMRANHEPFLRANVHPSVWAKP